MKRSLILLLLYVLCSTSFLLHAETTKDYAVLVTAVVQKAPPSIVLQWPVTTTTATSYAVYRKMKFESSWGNPLATLPGTATSFTDTDIHPAVEYEYKIDKTAKEGNRTYHGYGYLSAGMEVPAIEQRGTLLLIVDKTYSTVLAAEIARLESDMTGDGWSVIRHEVQRTDAVGSVKEFIVNTYKANPANVRSVFLLGHVPVPYSGEINPDGHPDHLGAWPADVYYADMDGKWTDTFVNNDTSAPKRTQNIPGDGKFDQSSLPSDVELQIGRVDLVHMLQFFTTSDTLLLKQYLDRDHAYRHKLFTPEMRGIIDDNWGTLQGEAPASVAWKNFSSIFGANISDNVSDANVDYIATMRKGSYLWSYGCGPGSFTGCGSVTTDIELSQDTIHTVFTGLFGSYFGDWDADDNLMRATLCSKEPALACYWGGRPHWYFNHMAFGEPIGYSTRLTQNNKNLYFGSPYSDLPRSIHIALMGDPTLRTHVIAPPSALTSKSLTTSVQLTWTASPEAVAGYYVFQAHNLQGPFVRISPQIITGTSFVDNCPLSGDNMYIVRAVKLQSSSGGSYYNLSQGIISGTVTISTAPALTIAALSDLSTLQFCPGDSLMVAITSTGPSCEGNLYTLQLSDTTGSFAGYLNLGTLQATHSGVIGGRIPIDIHSGARYRVRVVSTIPVSTAQDNGSDLTIFSLPSAEFSYTRNNAVVTFNNTSPEDASFRWDFGDGFTDTTHNPIHTFTKTGLYKVKLIVTNQCASDTITRNVILSITDVATSKREDDSSLHVYPNPNNGLFHGTIAGVTGHTIDISIIDALGREVYRWNTDVEGSVDVPFDLSSLARGIYSLQVRSADRIMRTTIIYQ